VGVSESGIAGDYSRLTYSPTAASGGERFVPQQQQTHAQQGFWQAPALTATAQERSAQGFSASIPQQQPEHQSQHNMPPSRRKRGQTDENDDSGDIEYAPGSANTGTAGAKTSRKRKSASDQGWSVGRAPGDVGPSLGIEIKTKFPVARIKRIMQADEDVGKVAQATPTAVCELTTFLIESSYVLLMLLTFLFFSSQST
jgi:Dr1-associated corepressor